MIIHGDYSSRLPMELFAFTELIHDSLTRHERFSKKTNRPVREKTTKRKVEIHVIWIICVTSTSWTMLCTGLVRGCIIATTVRHFWKLADCISYGIIGSSDDIGHPLNTLGPRVLPYGIFLLPPFGLSSLRWPCRHWLDNGSIIIHFSDLCERMLLAKGAESLGLINIDFYLIWYLNRLRSRSACRMANYVFRHWIPANCLGLSNAFDTGNTFLACFSKSGTSGQGRTSATSRYTNIESEFQRIKTKASYAKILTRDLLIKPLGSTDFCDAHVDRIRRRILLMISGVCMAVSLSGLSAFIYLKSAWEELLSVVDESTLAESSVFEELGWLPWLCLMSFIIAYSIGFDAIPQLVMGELFPLEYRHRLGTISAI
ncbi:Uncharacterized protein APZ42_019665 [Daphnia magna]|uniref:Uncharacterized protein n=1 Tax=Daphnia magna TaxID=35525 RepID=A0A164YCC6_9CRUS|nr:Uncharacterized protein APZ42_019665 [Daphnia magna]